MSQDSKNNGPKKWATPADTKASRAAKRWATPEDTKAKRAANNGQQAALRARPRSGMGLKIAGGLAALAAIVGLIAFGVSHKSESNEPAKPRKPGTELMNEYEKVALANRDLGGGQMVSDFRNHHQKALGWLKDGNITTSSKKLVSVRVTGEDGTVVEFEIMPHAIRFGDDVSWFMFPLDGPHSMAACKMLGLDLPTKWMSQELRIKIFNDGGKVRFLADQEIKAHLKERSTANDRDWSWKGLGRRKGPSDMRKPKTIRARGEILLKLLAEKKWDPSKPISGHFKEVIQDPRQAAKGKLATYRGCVGDKPAKNWRDDKWLGCTFLADSHPEDYHDYSHGVRCAKSKMKVGRLEGDKKKFVFKEMTIVEFYAVKHYRKEFSLPSKLDDVVYKYPDHLVKWMEEHK